MSIKTSSAAQEVLAKIREFQAEKKQSAVSTQIETPKNSKGFVDYLKDGFHEVNNMQKISDKMAVEVASGKSENIHETMLAATQAELSFNLMVQLRNKALEAYQEVMRMQI